jgi:protein SCO1/2
MAVALAILGSIGVAAQSASPDVIAPGAPAATGPGSALVPVASPGPAPALADLVSPDGSAFDLADLAGRPTLLFFGYTHCPDVCPLTIGEILGVFELEPDAQAAFVSIDPERDTPEFLTEWSAYLPADLHPVTGSLGAVRRAADEYGVRYARVETSSAGGYTFSHTADVFLIDEQGHLVGTFPFGTPADEMAADIASTAGGAS